MISENKTIIKYSSLVYHIEDIFSKQKKNHQI